MRCVSEFSFSFSTPRWYVSLRTQTRFCFSAGAAQSSWSALSVCLGRDEIFLAFDVGNEKVVCTAGLFDSVAALTMVFGAG